MVQESIRGYCERRPQHLDEWHAAIPAAKMAEQSLRVAGASVLEQVLESYDANHSIPQWRLHLGELPLNHY